MTVDKSLTRNAFRLRPGAATLVVASLLATVTASAATCPAGLSVINPTPTSEFLIDGNGTVTHTTTGLMWKRCYEGRSGGACDTGAATNMNWPEALGAAKNSAFAGYADWRLPNKEELESLIDDRCYSPSINDTVFAGTVVGWTWTSTTLASAPAGAWVVSFDDGSIHYRIKSDRDHFVRLVRGGQSFDALALALPLPILNLDGSDTSTRFAPATAGVLLLRYLVGFRDASLTAGALGTNPQRAAAEIAAHIAANLSAFDVDGDGKVLMTTDGVMILRRLLGLSGAALTVGAKNSARSDTDIAAAIDALKQ